MRHINKLRATILAKVSEELKDENNQVNCGINANELLNKLVQDCAPTFIEEIFCTNHNCSKNLKLYTRKFGQFALSDYFAHDWKNLEIAIENNLPREMICRNCREVGNLKRTVCRNVFIEVSFWYICESILCSYVIFLFCMDMNTYFRMYFFQIPTKANDVYVSHKLSEIPEIIQLFDKTYHICAAIIFIPPHFGSMGHYKAAVKTYNGWEQYDDLNPKQRHISTKTSAVVASVCFIEVENDC